MMIGDKGHFRRSNSTLLEMVTVHFNIDTFVLGLVDAGWTMGTNEDIKCVFIGWTVSSTKTNVLCDVLHCSAGVCFH